MTVTTLALGLFVLYELFPWLTAGLRGLHVLLTASSNHHCLTHTYPAVVDVSRLSKNKRRPQIVVAQNEQQHK